MMNIDLPRRRRIVRSAATVILTGVLGLTVACGPTLSIGSTPGQQATNADIQLVNGSAAGNGSSGDGGTPPAAPPGPAAPAQWVQLSASDTTVGQAVTDVNGHTLYRFDEDKPKPPTTNCSGPCATTWPPVTVSPGGKVFLDGMNGQAVGTVKRPDGSTQVTIGGWPVYRFSGDQKAGDVKGEGVKGTWFAVSPSGTKASLSGSSGSSGSTSATTSAPTSSNSGSAHGAALSRTTSHSGTVISDSSGRTVYVNRQDTRNHSHCGSGDCGAYSPEPAVGDPHTDIPGVHDSDIGSIRRADGTQQMTLDGMPLYTSNRDHGHGSTSSDGDGGQWYALGLDDDR